MWNDALQKRLLKINKGSGYRKTEYKDNNYIKQKDVEQTDTVTYLGITI